MSIFHNPGVNRSFFGYVFGLLGFALNDPDRAAIYSTVGRKVGEAIIYADCGYDWTRDKKKGLYNPVQTLEDSARAIAASQSALRDGTQAVKEAFGENSMSEQILLGVHDRLYRVAERDKRYRPYLVPLRECSLLETPKNKEPQGVILASCGGGSPPSKIHDPIGYARHYDSEPCDNCCWLTAVVCCCVLPCINCQNQCPL